MHCHKALKLATSFNQRFSDKSFHFRERKESVTGLTISCYQYFFSYFIFVPSSVNAFLEVCLIVYLYLFSSLEFASLPIPANTKRKCFVSEIQSFQCKCEFVLTPRDIISSRQVISFHQSLDANSSAIQKTAFCLL